jgi:hypothetical protein
MAAARMRVTTSLRAIWRSPVPHRVAEGGGRSFASEPHTALTPASSRAERPRRATRAGTICSRSPRVSRSQSRPRTAATPTATASAVHQSKPEPILPSGLMRSPWRTAATVPMATTATLGIRTAWYTTVTPAARRA